MPSIFISIDHDDPRLEGKPEEEQEPCCVEIEVDLDYEPGDANYGADADGNRGISIPGAYYADFIPPEKCDECGHVYDTDELKQLSEQADKKAAEYEYEPDIPEPDYHPEPGDYEPWS